MFNFVIYRKNRIWWVYDGHGWQLMPSQLKSGIFLLTLSLVILIACGLILIAAKVSLVMALIGLVAVTCAWLILRQLRARTTANLPSSPPHGWYPQPPHNELRWWDGETLRAEPVSTDGSPG